MKGEGPFRLRLLSTRDAERIAEVAIPGSRARERDTTVVSELGTEFLFSMMPEPEALPLRGGYLSKGDTLATPLVVEEVVSDSFELHVKRDVESLHLVLVDITTGEATAVVHGDVGVGETIRVDGASALCTVVAGCVVSGRPFEGYTTFVRPTRLELGLSVPETLLPGTELRVELSTKGSMGSTPVLLAVRDRRLTAADKPTTGLGAATKRAIAGATEGMETGPIVYRGTMYLTTLHYTVALDAATCRPIWRHEWEPKDVEVWRNNRGVAVARGRVVRGTSDGYLVALDASDGRLLLTVLRLDRV